MTKTYTCQFTGNCPYTGSSQSIRINYLEVPVLGTMNNGTKKDSYHCTLANECPYPEQDEYHRCPVYLQAPESAY